VNFTINNTRTYFKYDSRIVLLKMYNQQY